MLTQDKGLKGFKLSILGTDYYVRCVKSIDMPDWYFKENKGYCDHTVKTITVEDLSERRNDYNDILGDLEEITNQTMRHEIVHAFLRESGLGDESDIDEIFIDWLALQAPKIFKAFCQAKALSNEQIKECTEAFNRQNIKESGDINGNTRITNQ